MNKRHFLRQVAAFLLSSLLIAPYCGGFSAQAETPQPSQTMPLYTELTSCQAYLQQYENAPRPTSSVTVYGRDYQSVDIGTGETSVRTVGEEYGTENRDNVLLFAASEGSLTYEIEIPQTGCYCLYFSYLPIPSATSSVSFSVAIDGKVPYDTASRATLNKVFVNDGEQRFDDYGNQIRPAQHQTALWCESALSDTDGMWNEPLCFYLEAGTHEIGFQIEKGWFALDSFTFRNPEPLPDYAACRRASDETAEDTLLRLEGENAACKSDAALFPTADNSSYLVSPASPSRTVYNTIGAGNWRKAGQTISWTIPAAQITRNGWYRVAFKARQNEIRGFCSNRRLYLDGKVPCKELDCIRFPYSNKWQTVVPTDADGNSVELYLTAGEDHTLTLEVIPGDIGASLRRLDTAVRELRTDYRRILMLTSPNPDKYTDYYVHERIPGLLPDFTRLSEELRQIRTEIESLSGSKGSEAAAIERMSVILDACIERPLRIPDYLGQIRDNLTALSAWMYESREQPLEIDYIEIASPDCQFSSSKENPFRQAGFGVQRFFSSFFHDYTALSDDAGEDTIEVWVALGREQALAVKTLTDSLYNPTHETKISVNLVVGGIVEASLAGKGPDAALFLGGEFPVNLAARGLLTDLTQFPDYDKTAAQFAEQAAVPYTYQEGVYGLPLTQSWAMLFYRKDILAELGFDRPPETWDELIAMLPALQRNYMEAGLVLPVVSGTNAAISPATETGHTFAALMLQNGAGYYDAEQTRTTFDSIPAVQAFEKWTDFYTKYSFEQTYDAFSRFRTGEYPLVIADYGFCNQLAAAAPELRGLWDFTSIPGTVQPDGSISHAVNSTSSGAVIFDKCKDKQAAWEYLQWFTSEEVQAEFGLQTESLLGQMGRYATANTAARQKLPWSAAEQRKLTAAQEELREIPVTPASYAVTRGIMNAFRETVNNHENPRDTLLWYNREINAEITRKRENLGVETQP